MPKPLLVLGVDYTLLLETETVHEIRGHLADLASEYRILLRPVGVSNSDFVQKLLMEHGMDERVLNCVTTWPLINNNKTELGKCSWLSRADKNEVVYLADDEVCLRQARHNGYRCFSRVTSSKDLLKKLSRLHRLTLYNILKEEGVDSVDSYDMAQNQSSEETITILEDAEKPDLVKKACRFRFYRMLEMARAIRQFKHLVRYYPKLGLTEHEQLTALRFCSYPKTLVNNVDLCCRYQQLHRLISHYQMLQPLIQQCLLSVTTRDFPQTLENIHHVIDKNLDIFQKIHQLTLLVPIMKLLRQVPEIADNQSNLDLHLRQIILHPRPLDMMVALNNHSDDEVAKICSGFIQMDREWDLWEKSLNRANVIPVVPAFYKAFRAVAHLVSSLVLAIYYSDQSYYEEDDKRYQEARDHYWEHVRHSAATAATGILEGISVIGGPLRYCLFGERLFMEYHSMGCERQLMTNAGLDHT